MGGEGRVGGDISLLLMNFSLSLSPSLPPSLPPPPSLFPPDLRVSFWRSCWCCGWRRGCRLRRGGWWSLLSRRWRRRVWLLSLNASTVREDCCMDVCIAFVHVLLSLLQACLSASGRGEVSGLVRLRTHCTYQEVRPIHFSPPSPLYALYPFSFVC